MRYGILASPPEEPPPSAIVTVLDFVAGTYMVDGITQTAAEVVSDTGRISGSGLSMIGSTPITFLGAFTTKFALFDWTIILDFNISYSGPSKVLFLETTDNTFFSSLQLQEFAGFVEAYDDQGDFVHIRDLNDTSAFTFSVNGRLAYTRTDALAALSVNGGAVQSSSTVVSGMFLENLHGADSGQAGTVGYIRRIALIDPVTNLGMLPGLSTP